jgi:serine/threonine protein kinase
MPAQTPLPSICPDSDVKTYQVCGVDYGFPVSMLQQYQLVKLVTRTNLGFVADCVHKTSREHLILKASRLGVSPRENPLQETKILRQLNGYSGEARPFPPLVDEYLTSACHFFLMRPCGQDLFNFLQNMHPEGIPESICRGIWKQILFAVHEMHVVHEIAHMDLKPENILISDDGMIRLADFGQSVSTERLVCGLYGTPLYRSPEQGRQDGNRDLPFDACKSDMFALGMILFTLLTGNSPHGTGDRHLFLRMLSNEQTLNAWFNQFTMSADAITLIKNLWCPLPNARFTLQQAMRDPWTMAQ